MVVELYSRSWEPIGEFRGELVLLHGLLGSSRNWMTAGAALSKTGYRVHALDLRNHGESPHDPVHDYDVMRADLLGWLERENLGSVHLLGHSMGGKVAMHTAVAEPERVLSLCVVDISIRKYPPRWEKEFAAMRAIPVDKAASRSEVEAALEPTVADWAFRKFLLSNLERRAKGFGWKVNLDRLEAALPELFRRIPDPDTKYDGPARFIRGAKSRFLPDEDFAAILSQFPQAGFCTVSGAGHNVHFDQLENFVEAFERFLAPGEEVVL